MRFHILIFLILFFAFAPAAFAQQEENDSSKYADKAIVYVYSSKTDKMPGALKLPVFMDGKEIGNFRPARYFIAVIAPGKHAFHLKDKQKSKIEINFEAGKTYYLRGFWSAGVGVTMSGIVKVEPEMGAVDIKQLKPVDEADIKNKKVGFTKLPE